MTIILLLVQCFVILLGNESFRSDIAAEGMKEESKRLEWK